jgi:hypothetical protein
MKSYENEVHVLLHINIFFATPKCSVQAIWAGHLTTKFLTIETKMFQEIFRLYMPSRSKVM